MNDHNDGRFGSARRATREEIRAAGLMQRRGLYIGHFEHSPLHLSGDKSGAVVAGAGAGKGTGLVIPQILDAAGTNLWCNDPKGENAAVTLPYFVTHGTDACVYNPYGLHPGILPHHRMNVFEGLRPGHPRLAANCRLFAESLIILSGGGNSHFFEVAGRDIIDAHLQALVEIHGHVDLPMLYDAIANIAANPEAWVKLLDRMEKSSSMFVRRIAREMWSKRKDAPREFWATHGTVVQAFSFMNDPYIRESLHTPDFRLADQCLNDGKARVYFFVTPAEYAQQLAPLTRLIFTATFLAKSDAPDAPQITMILDEAGQLGKFEMIPRTLTYARGIGIRAVIVYQDFGQIEKAFGVPGMQSIIGSCGFIIAFNIRDPHSAAYVSRFLGNQTLAVDNRMQQREAQKRSEDALRRFLAGDDPLSTAYEYAHFDHAAQNRDLIQRPLYTPEEIINGPASRMFILLPGLVPPIEGMNVKYYDRPDYNGRWFANPHYGAVDHVMLKSGWFGFRRRHNVIEEPVPAHLAAMPQHQSGLIRYIEGFRTW